VSEVRIALIADSHVSLRSPECVRNWNIVAQASPSLDVALTLHLGDVTLDGQRHPEEIEYAAGLIKNWPTPIRCVPGNHDIGTGCGEEPLSVDKLSLPRGAGCRSLALARWRLGPVWIERAAARHRKLG
jgi:predicted phosphodiesterase